MNRRFLISLLALAGLGRALATESENSRPRHKISAAQLHEALSARFPVALQVAGVLELKVSAPRLLLLPSRNLLGATLVAQASGPAASNVEPGELDLVFNPRYEPRDRTLRARKPQLLDLRWPGMAPELLSGLRQFLPGLMREAVGEVVLHRFTARDFALADTMGFEPDELQVVDDGLVVWFGPKRSR